MMTPLSLKTISFSNIIIRGLDLTDIKRIPALQEDLQILDLLPGDYKVTSVVPDLKTAEGEDVEERVKAKNLQLIEGRMKTCELWTEVGQMITVRKKPGEQGPWWIVKFPQGCEVFMSLSRRRTMAREVDVLVEGIFEGRGFREIVWGKRVGEEVLKKTNDESAISLDADNYLVWEVKMSCLVDLVGEVVWSQVVRTERVEV